MGPPFYLAASPWPPGRAFSPARRSRRAASHGRSVGEDGRTGDQDARPGADHVTGGVLVDAPVHLELGREAAPVELGPGAGDLGEHLGHELLAPEAGMDGHAQNQVGFPQEGIDGLVRGLGVDGQPGSEAEALGLGQQRGGVAHLDVHRAPVRAGVAERLQELPRVGHHEMAVEEQPRVPAQ